MEGEEERRGGCWRKGLGKSHWLAPFLWGGGSIGEKPPAERYECRGNVASFTSMSTGALVLGALVPRPPHLGVFVL